MKDYKLAKDAANTILRISATGIVIAILSVGIIYYVRFEEIEWWQLQALSCMLVPAILALGINLLQIKKRVFQIPVIQSLHARMLLGFATLSGFAMIGAILFVISAFTEKKMKTSCTR